MGEEEKKSKLKYKTEVEWSEVGDTFRKVEVKAGEERLFHWDDTAITGIKKAEETAYRFDPMKLRDLVIETEKQREIYDAMAKMFRASPMDVIDHEAYRHGGIQQSKAKREFVEWGRRIALERGIPQYNREVGIPLGQRYIEPVLISGTDILIEHDELNFYNNCAAHQMIDDVKRTVIVGLDVPHRVIQLRLGKEISPESMNLFMETLQHTLSGGAVIQEHMAETHPWLSRDAYAKVMTGNDDLKAQFDRRWVLDPDKEFHPEKAEMLKKGIGDRLFVANHVHTLRGRITDGGSQVRASAIAIVMAFCAAYRLIGESVLSDLAYSAKHAQAFFMGLPTWQSRARPPNEPGGVPWGFVADFCANDAELPPVPFLKAAVDDEAFGKRLTDATIEAAMIHQVMHDSCWYGVYMSGGLGFPSANTILTMGNAFTDWLHRLVELVHTNFQGHERVPDKWDVVKTFIDMAGTYVMETFEKYPTLLEAFWGGALRMGLMSGVGGALAALLTGDSVMGKMGFHYAIANIAKEGWMRTGWGGQETQDHIGPGNLCSLRGEEGGLPELLGPNVPYVSYTVAHNQGFIIYSAMLGRGSAWATSPLIKLAFADPDLVFDFRRPCLMYAKGGLHEFEPAGERDIIRPAR
ncbi:coenzyme-B sulfoethylthiotransferase subunit alpha [Candidatus Alkanophaga liquidiphilum]